MIKIVKEATAVVEITRNAAAAAQKSSENLSRSSGDYNFFYFLFVLQALAPILKHLNDT